MHTCSSVRLYVCARSTRIQCVCVCVCVVCVHVCMHVCMCMAHLNHPPADEGDILLQEIERDAP